jgi:hypothetical protein
MKLLRRLLNATLVPLLALILIFEEWGWEPLARALGVLARLPLWARLERWISSLPPYAAMLVFFVPALALLPVKLLALYWIGQGHALLGLALIVVAKITGTALVARLFGLTRPALLRLAWFAHVYTRWVTWKTALLARLRASWAWRWSRLQNRRLRRAARKLRARVWPV